MLPGLSDVLKSPTDDTNKLARSEMPARDPELTFRDLPKCPER